MSDIKAMIGDAHDVLPEPMGQIIKAMIEGRVRQFVFVAEMEDGSVVNCTPTLGADFDRYRLLGALEVAKRDYMRLFIDSRVEYQEVD